MDRVWRVPTVFFRAIVALTAAVYLPMMFVFGPDTWTGIGPFAFQLSRILHYAAWFAAGVAVGAYGIDRSILATGGALAQRWLRWLGMAGVLYAVTVVAIATSISATTYVHARLLGFGVAFVLACAALNLAASALAVRFARRTRLLDSLRDNAYGMYLIHYAFVTWLQFALLRAGLPGVVKGVIAFAGATALSWLAVAALRRIPAVARIV
jgi:surface polysaccharide O-acyltransferase-like enzyme